MGAGGCPSPPTGEGGRATVRPIRTWGRRALWAWKARLLHVARGYSCAKKLVDAQGDRINHEERAKREKDIHTYMYIYKCLCVEVVAYVRM